MNAAVSTWTPVCRLEHIAEGMGVVALHHGQQVAIFKVVGRLYAIGNVDPYTGTGVLSRGTVSAKGGVLIVVSPLYQQSFALEDGRCLEDPAIRVSGDVVRIAAGVIEVGPERGQAPLAA